MRTRSLSNIQNGTANVQVRFCQKVFIFYILYIVVIAGAVAQSVGVTDAAVRKRIGELREALLKQQQENGSWFYARFPVGATALAVLALKHSGLPNSHPAVERGVDYIVKHFDEQTYSEGLVPCALEQVNPERYKDRIAKAVVFLSHAQNRSGFWSYSVTQDANRGDNSNAQFAILGLAAAERCDVYIPPQVKRNAIAYWYKAMHPQGGWGYTPQREATLPMTCAGIASLQLLDETLEKPLAECGRYRYNEKMNLSLKKLNQMLEEDQFGHRRQYTLYALERVGIFLDIKKIGGRDWYRYGAEKLLGQQIGMSISDLALELLFLAKGNAPIAIAKWEWDGAWNMQHHDVSHWVEMAGKKLKTKLDWITARIDRPDSPAAKASLLFVNGAGEFKASDQEYQFLRAFLKDGGVIVGEACCNDRTFQRSFAKQIAENLFPGQKLGFVKVAPKHPVCDGMFKLKPIVTGALELKGGCSPKNVLFLSREISSVLEERPRPQEEEVRARKVAVNLIVWAMDFKPPTKKLDEQVLVLDGKTADKLDGDEPELVGTNLAQPFGRLQFRDQWSICAGLFTHLRAMIKDQPQLPQFDGELLVEPLSPELFHCAVLFIAGSEAPRMAREEINNLREYVQLGGAVMACPCSCSDEFDPGFRKVLQSLFPHDELEEIPDQDPVWTYPYQVKARRIKATPAYREKYGDQWAPLLGIRREGRWAVIYSPVDLCCGFEEEPTDETVGYRPEDAFPIIANILHYVVTP